MGLAAVLWEEVEVSVCTFSAGWEEQEPCLALQAPILNLPLGH